MILPLDPIFIYLEIFFISISAICTFLIYFKTKEIYELTESVGIKYFREGFLFLGIANIILILNHLFMTWLIANEIRGIRVPFEFFALFNLIGLGYLFASLFSRKIKEYYIFILTLSIFLLGFLFRTKGLIFIYLAILIISLGIISFIKLKTKKKEKHFSQIYLIYILIFFSWVLMIFGRVFNDIYLKGRLYHEIITAFIFMYILYLVIQKLELKSNKRNL